MTKKEAIKPIESSLPPAQTVKIRNLITTPTALRRVMLGDVEALDGWTKRYGDRVEALLWCEDEISLVVSDPDLEVRFVPEIHPATSVFIRRDEKFSRDDDMRIWEGDYAPVHFSKTNLLKYLKANAAYFDAAVQEAVRNLKVTQRNTQATELISLEDDESYRAVEEQVQDTNLPARFHATLPLFGDVTVELEFEARVVPARDRYGHETGGSKKAIEVRCVNAREGMRGAMRSVLAGLPPELPAYYGRMRLSKKGA
jgi:hypothetical protein